MRKTIPERINTLISGLRKETVKEIFEECLETYNEPKPIFMYSVNGEVGDEFEADDYATAVQKAAEKSGILVWKP